MEGVYVLIDVLLSSFILQDYLVSFFFVSILPRYRTILFGTPDPETSFLLGCDAKTNPTR